MPQNNGRGSILESRSVRHTRLLPIGLVFLISGGKPRDRHNLRQRVVAPIVKRADELLAESDAPPLPAGISPHKLRHTFASLLVALGNDPASVMAQLGHTDPAFTLRVYTHVMRRGPGERERLRALVEGCDPDAEWALLGTGGASKSIAAHGLVLP
jgi:integrase